MDAKVWFVGRRVPVHAAVPGLPSTLTSKGGRQRAVLHACHRSSQRGSQLGAACRRLPPAGKRPGQGLLCEAGEHRPSVLPEGAVGLPGSPRCPQPAALPHAHGRLQPGVLVPLPQQRLAPAGPGRSQSPLAPAVYRTLQLGTPVPLLREVLPPGGPGLAQLALAQAHRSSRHHLALVGKALHGGAPGCRSRAVGSKGSGFTSSIDLRTWLDAKPAAAQKCAALSLPPHRRRQRLTASSATWPRQPLRCGTAPCDRCSAPARSGTGKEGQGGRAV